MDEEDRPEVGRTWPAGWGGPEQAIGFCPWGLGDVFWEMPRELSRLTPLGRGGIQVPVQAQVLLAQQFLAI